MDFENALHSRAVFFRERVTFLILASQDFWIYLKNCWTTTFLWGYSSTNFGGVSCGLFWDDPSLGVLGWGTEPSATLQQPGTVSTGPFLIPHVHLVHSPCTICRGMFSSITKVSELIVHSICSESDYHFLMDSGCNKVKY